MSLDSHFFIVAQSHQLKLGQPLQVRLGERHLALFRDQTGAPMAVEDRCAHRNAPLSAGWVEDGCLRCPYHGWSYDGAGKCRSIPALETPPQVQIPSFTCRESQGFIWCCPGRPAHEPHHFPHLGDKGWSTFVMESHFAATEEACLENFLDCPHTVFVHGGWFRSRSAQRPVQARISRDASSAWVDFEEDAAASPSVISRLLFPKDKLQHRDRFLLPAISRVDYRFSASRHYIISSQCSSHGKDGTRVWTVMTSRHPLGPFLRLFYEPLSRLVIRQDLDILKLQANNIARFGGPRFTDCDADLLGPHIRALRQAAREGRKLESIADEKRELRF